MIRGSYDWHGGPVSDALVAEAWKRLCAAVVYYHTQLLLVLNVSNPRPYTTPSKPGEPPRKRTGWLQSHVLYELDEATHTARVGVAQNAIYGLYLELAKKWHRRREWLVVTLRKHWDRICAIAGVGR